MTDLRQSDAVQAAAGRLRRGRWRIDRYAMTTGSRCRGLGPSARVRMSFRCGGWIADWTIVRRTNRRDRAARARPRVQIRRHRFRRTRRAAAGRRGARPRPHRPDHGSAAPAHAGRIGAPRRFRAPSSRGRAGRAHSRREGILGTAAATLARDAGAAARYRDGGRTGAGDAARRRRPQSPAAHRRSRHRLRRDSAGAVVRIAGAQRGSAPTSREAALQTAAANAARAGLSERATFIACDYASGLSGPFDLIVSNPPYIRSADIGGLAVEVRESRPPGRARWRRRRA